MHDRPPYCKPQDPLSAHPRFRVWSRRIGECLKRCQVAEAFKSSPVIAVDETMKEFVSLSMREEEPMSNATFRLSANSFNNAAVETFNQAVGLRPERLRQSVMDLMLGADAIKGMAPRRTIMWLVLHVDGKAVGELAAIIGENGVNGIRKVGEETLKKGSRCFGVAPGMDFQINITSGAIDGDEGIALALMQGRQVLEINVNEANRCLLKAARLRT